MTRSKHLAALIVAIVSLSLAGGYILMLRSAPTEIRMATWRNDDFVIWNSTLLPPFQAQHSDITISYNSEASNYSGRLRKAFELGRAADVVACYPGKIYHEFAQNGYLRPLGELEVLQGYAP